MGWNKQSERELRKGRRNEGACCHSSFQLSGPIWCRLAQPCAWCPSHCVNHTGLEDRVFLVPSIPLALVVLPPPLSQSFLNPEGRDLMGTSLLGLGVPRPLTLCALTWTHLYASVQMQASRAAVLTCHWGPWCPGFLFSVSCLEVSPQLGSPAASLHHSDALVKRVTTPFWHESALQASAMCSRLLGQHLSWQKDRGWCMERVSPALFHTLLSACKLKPSINYLIKKKMK